MSIERRPEFIVPDWPAPAHVKAVSTTRGGGVSLSPYDSFNLATHVEDDAARVRENRTRLMSDLDLPAEPAWLEQVHGVGVVDVGQHTGQVLKADASLSRQPGQVCVVMTADCLPVLICDHQGTQVAAAHAGWRGLADGVIEATVDAMQSSSEALMVWLGPAIGPQAFEVGHEVREVFVRDMEAAEAAFTAGAGDRYMADIYQLARLRLARRGIEAVYGGEYCTYSDANRFYSFRRDGTTGRQASLIWLENEANQRQ